MERNFVRASDTRVPLARKVIAAVIGTIGISLLAFAGPMQKVIDSSLRTNPLVSGAHLAIENQKGLTNEPLPLGISVIDASGGETVIIAGLAEGTELSLGTAMGSGIWLVPVADLDNTFVGAPMSFVGVMTAKVTLNSASGKRLDARNIRFDWSKPEFSLAPSPEETEQTRGSVPPSPALTGGGEEKSGLLQLNRISRASKRFPLAVFRVTFAVIVPTKLMGAPTNVLSRSATGTNQMPEPIAVPSDSSVPSASSAIMTVSPPEASITEMPSGSGSSVRPF